MHLSRLVGSLACMGALLTLLVLPSAVLARGASSSSPSPTPAATASPSVSPEPTPAPTPPALTQRQLELRRIKRQRVRVVALARRQLGIPYVWGGASPSGFDCSGLTMYVYRRVGISLSHSATLQSRRGRRVSVRHLKPGDLVFFGSARYYHHVGIYIGGGRMIDAPHRGARVRVVLPWRPSAARRLLHL